MSISLLGEPVECEGRCTCGLKLLASDHYRFSWSGGEVEVGPGETTWAFHCPICWTSGISNRVFGEITNLNLTNKKEKP